MLEIHPRENYSSKCYVRWFAEDLPIGLAGLDCCLHPQYVVASVFHPRYERSVFGNHNDTRVKLHWRADRVLKNAQQYSLTFGRNLQHCLYCRVGTTYSGFIHLREVIPRGLPLIRPSFGEFKRKSKEIVRIEVFHNGPTVGLELRSRGH